MKNKIDFANLQFQYQLYKNEIDQNIQTVLDKSNFIMGEQIFQLEEQLANFLNAKHCITCSSGTDALLLAMMALDINAGDEVITTPFSFISTAETIALLKAKPVFIDIDPDTFNIDVNKIEQAITKKTKVIMPVSLYGQPSDMNEINSIAKKYNLKIITDGAQSFGASYQQKSEVDYCDIHTTSFFPAKPFGCYGDGGAIFTNNGEYAEKMRMMRTHGQNKRYHHKYIGIGARLDTIQAAVLLAKLSYYKKEIKNRNRVAKAYSAQLNNTVKIPIIKSDRTSVWAQYTIRVNNRDNLRNELKKFGIPTSIHYSKPMHLQECFSYLGLRKGHFPISEDLSHQVVSLPMNPFLLDNEIEYVITKITHCLND